MKFILPDSSRFTQFNSSIYLYGGIDLDRTVSRYMNIEELIGMLKGKLSFSMRKNFLDLLEHGIPYNQFAHCQKIVGESITDNDIQRWNLVKENRISISNWFTKCFSKDVNERASLWKCFAKNIIGVMIQLKLKDFVLAIDSKQ